MPFYRVTEAAVTIRLSNKNPEKKFFPKWRVDGQNFHEVAIHSVMGEDTIGLYLRDRVAYRISAKTSELSAVPCVELLVGDTKQIIPKQFVAELTPKDIENIIDE